MQMKSLLEGMTGKLLKVHRHGPDSKVGKLLEFNADFLTLLTEEDGVVYVNTQHIKSLSQHAKDNQNNNQDDLEDLNYCSASSFQDLFQQLQYSWVSINKGPEKVEGVLNDFGEDLVTVVAGDEIIHLTPFHIKTISYGCKPKNEEGDSSDDKGNGEKSNKKEGKNKEEKSGKNKSKKDKN